EVVVAPAGSDDDGGTGLVVVGGIEGEGGDIFRRVTEAAGSGFVPQAECVKFGGGVDDLVSWGGGLWCGGLGGLRRGVRPGGTCQKQQEKKESKFQGASSPEEESRLHEKPRLTLRQAEVSRKRPLTFSPWAAGTS